MKGTREAQGMIIYYYSEPGGAVPLAMPGPFLLPVFFCGWAFWIQDPNGTKSEGMMSSHEGMVRSHALSAQDCAHGAGETQGPRGPRAEAWTLAVLGNWGEEGLTIGPACLRSVYCVCNLDFT